MGGRPSRPGHERGRAPSRRVPAADGATRCRDVRSGDRRRRGHERRDRACAPPRSLGYANLRELRAALAEHAEEADLSTRLHATIGDSPTAHDVLSTAVDRHVDALNTLMRRIPAADFDDAVAVLARARHVWWSGTGPSAHLADYAAFLCRRLGTSSGSFTHAGTDHADELLALDSDDAVVVLAYGRMHPYVRVLLAARR